MMSRNLGNLALADYNDIFNVGKSEQDGEYVAHIPLGELFPPEFHPFQVNDDEAMKRLVRSVEKYGVREPGLARPRDDGGYELLCGNRRKRACELAGVTEMPVIIREMNDDDAVIAMVDSNLEQREGLLFSEKAWAYRAKMEALNHNGIKADMDSVEVLVQQTGESKNQIFRLIRLTELVPGLLDKVDTKQLAFNPAVELSYLSRKEQTTVADAMEKNEIKPSLSQSVQLKKIKQSGKLTNTLIDEILSKEKNPTVGNGENHRYRHFFPVDYTQSQIDKVIIGLLHMWQKQQEQMR